MLARRILDAARSAVNRSGYDVVSYPRWNTAPWALSHLLPQLGVSCVLDVGGHHGEYGLMLREVGYRGHIVSFEPTPSSFALLSEKCAADPKWSAHNFALGSEEGTLPINVTAAQDFVSFLQPDPERNPDFAAALAVTEVREVPVKRLRDVLDQVVAHVPRPVLFLKSDTQGFDFQVLDGLGPRIGELRGVQVELALQPLYQGMQGFQQSLAALAGYGFELYCLSPVSHDSAFRVVEYDCITRRAAG
jgi:FkbM family methyltransferase